MNIKNIICSFALCCFVVKSVSAQTIRAVTVSQKESFTDHISMEEDATDKDVMVKFVFDEAANTLTVSLISYRSLFVFREAVRYKPLIKGRTIRPDQLPYMVTFDPKETYKLSKLFKSTVPRPRKEFFFKRWIEYEGLQPVPQDYSMVNDYITQTFDILNKRSQVSVTLRDILLMDDVSKSADKKRYEIPFGRDMYREYQISIQRDPCFGLSEDLAIAKNALESISKGYASIKEKYGSGKVASKASLSVFQEMKDLLIKQFPHKDMQSPCPDIQQTWDEYNQIVSSISSMTCEVTSSSGNAIAGGEGVSAKLLLNKARQIDAFVSRWLMSNDIIERRDIIQQCESTIQSVNAAVKEQGVRTTEQQQALNVFREAVRYYQSKCR